MTQERIEEISGRIVEIVFGAGYISKGAGEVFRASAEILKRTTDENAHVVSSKLG